MEDSTTLRGHGVTSQATIHLFARPVGLGSTTRKLPGSGPGPAVGAPGPPLGLSPALVPNTAPAPASQGRANTGAAEAPSTSAAPAAGPELSK